MSFTTKYKVLATVAPVIVLLDQLTKAIVLRSLEIGERVTLIPKFFDIVHVRNTGAAFGLFQEIPEAIRVPFFYGVMAVALVILAVTFLRLKAREHFLPVPLSLIVGGVMGNGIDRVRFGEVVDFISWHIGDKILNWSLLGRPVLVKLEWPSFNIADSAITISMFLLAFYIMKVERRVKP